MSADPSDAINRLLQQAMAHHQGGRLAEAERIYREILKLAPAQPLAHNRLGAIAQRAGYLDAAADLMARAARLAPGEAGFHLDLGNVLLAKGDANAAAGAFRSALSLVPGDSAAHAGLGFALRAQGRSGEALDCFEQAARLDPGRWEAAFNLGCAYEQTGRLQRALECYERAVSLQPRAAPALCNLGNAKSQLRRFAEAEADLRRALELEPNAAVVHLNLGAVLLAQAKTDEAIACYRRAIAIAPGLAEAYNNLGRALQEKKEFDEQVGCCMQALQLRPDYANAMVNLGCGLLEQGRTAEAIEWFRRALAINPDDNKARANVQYSMILLPEYDMAALSRANRDFWLHQGARDEAAAQYANAKDPQKRLRLGFVSADFRRHAAAYFMEPIFAHHDREHFEIFCYCNNELKDAYTARFQALADGWRNVAAATDAELAALVRNDGIDILLDLSGHTIDSRITAFARHPAPIQVTYLGYAATTGLDAMDYRLTDAVADPAGAADSAAGADAFYTEKLWRLPNSLWCYAPPPDMPEVNALPALANGYVTFGSFNNVNKLSAQAVALWARVLTAVPDSRLLITSIPPGTAQQRMLDQFAGHGIAAARLQMMAARASVEFLRLYHAVDLALDSFPCNGATSTCESLWMGVPVISLTGRTFAGRAGLSLLSACGHREWVAASEQEYVDIATNLAGNLAALSAIRGGLRESARRSPLGDAKRFARDVQNAFREMWVAWSAAED